MIDVTHLIKGSLVLVLLSCITSGISYFGSVIIASKFGASGLTDAFFAASFFPILIGQLQLMAFLNFILVPLFSKYLVSGNNEEFWKAASAIWNFIALAVSGIVLLGFIFAPMLTTYITGRGFSREIQLLTTRLTRILFPAMIFFGLGGVTNSLLYVKKRLYVQQAGMAISNIIAISSIFVFITYYGIYSVALGVTAGAFIFLIIQLIALYKEKPTYHYKVGFSHPIIKEFKKIAIPQLLIACSTMLYGIVVLNIGSRLVPGSISVLSYATRLCQIPSFIGGSIAIVAFPYLSFSAAKGDLSGFRGDISKNIRTVFIFMLPVLALLIALRFPIVKLFFERGAFDEIAVFKTANALAVMSISVIAYGVAQILLGVIYALKKQWGILAISIANTCLTILFIAIFSLRLQYLGIALGTSLVALCNVVMLLIFVRHVLRRIGARKWSKLFFKTLVASIVCAGMAVLCYEFIGRQFASAGIFGELIHLVLSLLAGVVVYVFILLVLKIKE